MDPVLAVAKARLRNFINSTAQYKVITKIWES